VQDESVDLIYLDPPFNSKATYNLLFRELDTKEQSHSQIAAFEDTWHWGHEAQIEYSEIMKSQNLDLAELIQALRKFLKESDMMAYLVMMANRLLELHRVLKPTGSLYLHCDPTASHYLKLVLDAIFGFENYQAEIIWKRSSAHSDTKQGREVYGHIHDTILFYSKSNTWTWNPLFTTYDKEYTDTMYRYVEEGTGRRYRLDNLTGPGGAAKGNPKYEVFGVERYWRYSKERMEKLIKEGRIIQTAPGNVPSYKRYLDEMPGVPLQDIWTDIAPIGSSAQERLGYPTQKPSSLLERIIHASSNEGDIILDPFCGCGTAIHAAQKLNRQWIGIDITHLAISLIEKRLKDAFPGIQIDVQGTPKDFEAAKNLFFRDPYQFQWWAVSLVNGIPYQGKKKGADSGIDGIIYFDDGEGISGKYGKIIISVKGGEHINVGMIRDLKGTIERDKAAFGLFITLAEPTEPMRKEASSAPLYPSKLYPSKSYPTIQILTIEGLLNGTERPDYPNISPTDIGMKSIGKEKNRPKQENLF